MSSPDEHRQNAAQKIREARHHVADIPRRDKTGGDIIAAIGLGLLEELYSKSGGRDE